MAENKIKPHCNLLVIGGSAGSLEVLLKIFPKLKINLDFAIVIVLHRKNSSESSLADLFSSRTTMRVKEVEDKQPVNAAHVYIAPADYHVLFEKSRVMSLDYSEKINYSRPSIDVTFESAAEVYQQELVCMLLSGANSDGSAGLKIVKEHGGGVVIQDPASAESSYMPQQAINSLTPDYILRPEEMADYINSLSN